MQPRKPLNRQLTIVLAIASMWLVSNIGFVVGFQLLPKEGILNDWTFIGLRGYDIGTIGQIGAFFLAWFGVQIPAAYFAGVAIALSDFNHPLRVTFWTMASYHAVLSVVRAFHWLWRAFPELNQSIPVLFYLIAVFSLIGVSVFFTWFMPRLIARVQRYSAH